MTRPEKGAWKPQRYKCWACDRRDEHSHEVKEPKVQLVDGEFIRRRERRKLWRKEQG